MTTLHFRKSIDRSPLRLGIPRVQRIWIIRGFLLITLAFACFGLLPPPNAFGVSPAPDGGYPNRNTAEGTYALLHLTTGASNTAIGTGALFSNTTASGNTATGDSTLLLNTTGTANTANGASALFNNTTGSNNTATGYQALLSNTIGPLNAATGYRALYSNTTGQANTATGAQTLVFNTTGGNNTATGVDALYGNTTGHHNTASGLNALLHNTTGYFNTATGGFALYSNITGHDNTAEGFQALYHNTGSNNIALGSNAGFNLTTGSGNVCIGQGVLGVAGESNTTRIRNVYASLASGRAVYVNSDNKIGTLVSSQRFKDKIKLMDKASEAILALKPVTFRYKKEIEPNGAIMFGLIAEEVEKVDPDLVTRNDKGEAETVRYDAVNAMLLNEFLKQHHQVRDLKAIVAKQQKQIEALTTGLQKVSAEFELIKPAPQMASSNE
jgi:hypothetical protein